MKRPPVRAKSLRPPRFLAALGRQLVVGLEPRDEREAALFQVHAERKPVAAERGLGSAAHVAGDEVARLFDQFEAQGVDSLVRNG